MGLFPDNTVTADLLDEGYEQLGIWHIDDVYQEDGSKESQGISTAKKTGLAQHREREHSRLDPAMRCLGCRRNSTR